MAFKQKLKRLSNALLPPSLASKLAAAVSKLKTRSRKSKVVSAQSPPQEQPSPTTHGNSSLSNQHAVTKYSRRSLVLRHFRKAKPLKKFHLFSRLPTELRLMIWKLALPPPETLQLEGNSFGDFGRKLIFVYYCIREQTRLPLVYDRALLRACFESREVYCASRPYVLPFLALRADGSTHYYHHWRHHQIRFGDEDKLHIENFDDMCRDEERWAAMVRQEWVAKVKTLIIPLGWYMQFDWVRVLREFKSLRRVEVVADLPYLEWLRKWALISSMDRAGREIFLNNIEGVGVPELVFRDF
ncbi:hypothetical protein EG329_009568 [Mollisiaceae sp. DMI_Dod_QoI]|nr:hypothetical protein EG329_009568 [Helotiales sp. DMI_Dod_QoI]